MGELGQALTPVRHRGRARGALLPMSRRADTSPAKSSADDYGGVPFENTQFGGRLNDKQRRTYDRPSRSGSAAANVALAGAQSTDTLASLSPVQVTACRLSSTLFSRNVDQPSEAVAGRLWLSIKNRFISPRLK